MNLRCLLSNVFSGLLNGILGNGNAASFTPTIQSITETREKNNQQLVTAGWDNLNSSYVLSTLVIIGALFLSYNCYGTEKREWLDDCIINQILFLILISLLFNLESRAIPNSINVTGVAGTSKSESDVFIQTQTSGSATAGAAAVGEAAAIATSAPSVIEVVG